MKIKALITEDTTSEYLDKLEQNINDQEVSLAGDLAKEFTGTGGTGTGHIPKHMSTKFNPNLFMSGADERYWQVSKGDVTTIEILYTGMRLHEEYSNPLVWWQFATEDTMGNLPRERTLERDYAYFQETGIDNVAKPELAKHKHAVQKGLSEASEKDLSKVGEYLIQIMQGKQVGTSDSFFGSRL